MSIHFVQFQINEKQMQKNQDQNESKLIFHLKNELLKDIKIEFSENSK